MKDKSHWDKALIFSILFHVMAFTFLSGLAVAEKRPQEEILEMAIIDDLGLYGGKGSDAAQGVEDSGPPNISPPNREEVSVPQPQIPQNTPPEIKQPEKRMEKIVSEPKALSPAPVAAVPAAASLPASSGGGAAGSGAAGGGLSGTGSEAGSGSGNGNSGSGKGGGIVPPAVLSSVKPPYPAQARQKGIQGIVELRVLISENGRAGDASVVSSSGDASLDAAALAVINKWRFIPAKDLATGKALARYTRLSVKFELK